jgi:predicted nucleic acid-binding Zn ribbon protein
LSGNSIYSIIHNSILWYSGCIMIFKKQNQKLIKRVFTVVGILIILSMVLLYFPILWR